MTNQTPSPKLQIDGFWDLFRQLADWDFVGHWGLGIGILIVKVSKYCLVHNYQIEKISHQISYYPKKRMGIFNSLNLQQKSETIKHLSKYVQKELATKLSDAELVEIVERLDPDEATDILQLLPEHRSKLIIAKLNEQLRNGISLLLKFDPDTAAGLMDINYIHINQNDSIASVAKQVKIHEKRTGKTPLILAMDNGVLAGYLPVHELGFSGAREKAAKYVKKIKTIK